MKTFDQIREEADRVFDEMQEKLGMATAGEHEDAAHAHRTASNQPKQDLRAVKAHEKAADHHDTAAKHLKNGDSYAAQIAHFNAKNEADKAKDYGNVHSKRAHADTRAIGEGYASAAQRRRAVGMEEKTASGKSQDSLSVGRSQLPHKGKTTRPTDRLGMDLLKKVRFKKIQQRAKELRREDKIGEGFVSAAQRRAVWASKADGGKGHPDNKKEELSPAQKDAREKNRIGPKGEVGKREYGSDKAKRGFHKSQRGVSGKGDNRNTMSIFDRQPKTALQGNKPKGKLPEAKSADLKPEKYIGPDGKTKIRMVPVTREDTSAAVKAFLAKGGKIKKLPPAKAQGYHGKDDPGADVHGLINKPDTKDMGTRKKVKSMEATQVDEISKDTKKSYIKKAADDMAKQADRMARAQRGDGTMDKAANKFVNRRKGIARAVEANETDPPFDNAKKISTTPTKDQFGNVIKNRAKSLARAAAKKAGGDMGDKQKKESVNELDQKTMNSYHAKAQKSKDKATNSAVATILRKGDHSKDLQTRNKRVKGMALAKTRTLKSIRGDK